MNEQNIQIENLFVQSDDDDENDSLNSREWSLLTYIVRTYDVDRAVQLVQHPNQKRKILNLDFFQEHKRSKLSSNLFSLNQSLLTNSQRTLLSNIVHVYDTNSAIPIVQRILRKQSSRQPKLRFKLNHTLNIINRFFQTLTLFTNEIMRHTMITKHDEKQIIERNFHSIGCLNGLFIGRETYLLHNRAHSTNFQLIYSDNLMLITNRLIYHLEQNGILFKLFLVVLLFSSHLSIISYTNIKEIKYENQPQLNEYQNIFIDLLWKYMLYKYDFQECVYRFSMMVKIVVDLIDQLYRVGELSKAKQLLK